MAQGKNGGRTFLSAISIHITNGKHADGERQEKLTTESAEEEREINHKRHKGTKAQRHKGTKGTKAQRHKGTKGTKAQRHKGTKAQRHKGTKAQRHKGTQNLNEIGDLFES